MYSMRLKLALAYKAEKSRKGWKWQGGDHRKITANNMNLKQ